MLRSRRAFGLVELLVVIAVAAILGALSYAALSVAEDRARTAHCISNLRSISSAALMYVSERDGMLWSREEAGYSAYRQVEDPLGVPKLLEAYISNKKVWWCLAGRPNLKIFGNNYTWTLSPQYDERPALAVNTAMKTLLFWDNSRYTLPSVMGVPDSNAPSIGPKSPGTRYERIPHYGRQKSNWAFLDGHVITGKSSAQ